MEREVVATVKMKSSILAKHVGKCKYVCNGYIICLQPVGLHKGCNIHIINHLIRLSRVKSHFVCGSGCNNCCNDMLSQMLLTSMLTSQHTFCRAYRDFAHLEATAEPDPSHPLTPLDLHNRSSLEPGPYFSLSTSPYVSVNCVQALHASKCI